jgi:uncharacterized membrane protein YkvA (DUF1232 family)
MGVLDADRVRAALGVRLADRFLQYATRPQPGERGRLLIRIDEHVAGARGDAALATRIANACRLLVLRADDEPEVDARAAIVGAVRYFVDTYDLAPDDAPRGYDDDAKVVDYVIDAVAPDLARVGG